MVRPRKLVPKNFEEFAANRARWDFSASSLEEHGIVGDDMLLECWAYEFSRENRDLTSAILEWRKSLGSAPSFERFKKESWGSPFLQIKGDAVRGTPDRLISIPFLATYVFFPEWPNASFLELAAEERNRRIRLGKNYSWYASQPNWIKGLEEYPATLEANPKSLGLPDALEDFVSSLRASLARLGNLPLADQNKFRVFAEDELCGYKREAELRGPRAEDFIYAKAEYVVFRIPWKYHDKVILSLMSNWLKENRPDSEKPPKMSEHAKTGKTPLRTIREHLEMLGKWRLARNNGEDPATLHPITSELLLTDASHWAKVDAVIRHEIRRFDPTSTSSSAKL